jgi:hypothetical protein
MTDNTIMLLSVQISENNDHILYYTQSLNSCMISIADILSITLLSTVDIRIDIQTAPHPAVRALSAYWYSWCSLITVQIVFNTLFKNLFIIYFKIMSITFYLLEV